MKTIHTTLGKLVLFLALTFAIASCSSNEDPAPVNPVTPPANSSFITAKVNGQDFSTYIFGVSAASGSSQGTAAGRLIQVVGSNFGSNSIAINLLGIDATGTYNLDANSDSVIAYTPGSATASYGTGGCDGASGTITITTLTATKIEGTFSFVGKDVDNCASSEIKIVTDGAFRCNFVN